MAGGTGGAVPGGAALSITHFADARMQGILRRRIDDLPAAGGRYAGFWNERARAAGWRLAGRTG